MKKKTKGRPPSFRTIFTKGDKPKPKAKAKVSVEFGSFGYSGYIDPLPQSTTIKMENLPKLDSKAHDARLRKLLYSFLKNKDSFISQADLTTNEFDSSLLSVTIVVPRFGTTSMVYS